MTVDFRDMLAGDLVQLELQSSQVHALDAYLPGMSVMDKGRDLAENGTAWTAIADGRIIACGGFRDIYAGQGLAWVAMADGVGAAHLAVTRHARRCVESGTYHRIEATVEADNDRAIAWATIIGLEPVHTLRKWGPNVGSYILFERVA